ncbi:MAG: hypothetical protein SFY69_00090 [Planctomycetota bacterium]|nr:hypothetical protein [Planctomycetota bacterium]
MTTDPPAVFPGEDLAARGVALAGWLAEQGVTRLTLIDAAVRRSDHRPRETDLPGLLVERVARTGACRVHADRWQFTATPGALTSSPGASADPGA